MCLFPKFIKNPRYNQYKLKKGDIKCTDYRKLYVPIGCGECYECRKQKAQQWRVRLTEELKVQQNPIFVTLTFSNEELDKLCDEAHTKECNAIATIAVRRFLERWRKQHQTSLKHWLITELGHKGTERIHLHGILFPNEPIDNETLQKYWKYGITDIGKYCNLQTINYIVKYVTKIDTDHKGYRPIVLTSAGIGANFIESSTAKRTYKYIKGKSAEYYTLPDGRKVALPIYYRNKLYTETERDNLWTDRLDKGEIYVNGIRIRNIQTDAGQQHYYAALKNLQQWNNNIGYGNTSKQWEEKTYNVTFKMLQRARARK